jgi:glycopeptide antibiotics resistance protein
MVKDTLISVFENNYAMIIIFTVVLVTIRMAYLISHKVKFELYRELFMLSFLLYSLILFYVVTFQDVNYGTNNFIPFKEIMRYEIGSSYFIHNVLGNILLFIPFGFFVSFILRTKKPAYIIIITIITSFVIEYVQLLIGRTFDVDDILLNIVGGFLGYLVYLIIQIIYDKLPSVLKKTWIKNLCLILVIIGIVVLYYSTTLWGIIR